MAANHATHEALYESALNSGGSEINVLADNFEDMTMFKELVEQTEFQNNFVETDEFFDGNCSGQLNAGFSNTDTTSEFSAFDELIDSPLWSQNVTPMHFSATMDSPSSIFDVDWAVGSPVSTNIIEGGHNQAKGGASGSLCEQSEVDDKASPTDKQLRRRILNKESARISRTRKRAQLLGLELQAQTLTMQNATLYKQLMDSRRQFSDANTNNRILKSNVEALRAKVKLAEGMISRVNNQLVQNQNQINTATQLNHMNGTVGRMAHVSAANTGHENDTSYAAMVLFDQFGNDDILFSNFSML